MSNRTSRIGGTCVMSPVLLLSLAAGISGGLAAPAVAAADEVSLSFPGGGVFHTTTNAVTNFRTIAVPGSTNVIALWNEQTANGPASFYAVSLDGHSLAGRVRDIDYTIDLRYGKFDPIANGEPVVNPALRADASNELYIVQFHTVPLDSYYSQVNAAGGRVYDYLGSASHIVRLDAAGAKAVAGMPFVRWVGAMPPAYRADENATSALISAAPDSTDRWSITVLEDGLHQQNFVKGLIEALGGTVHYTQDEMFRMEATMSPATLREVLNLNEVKFVDPWSGPAGLDMDIGRSILGTNYVQSGSINFDGTGVRGEIFDTETPATNPEWNTATGGNGVIYHSNGNAGTHGSSCFGICFARGVSAQHKGHMPKGQGIFFFLNTATTFGGTKTRLTIAQESIDPNGQYRSVFQTSSVGSPQTSVYTSLSAEMDDVLFKTNYLHCQSQSNLGTTSSRPQAWAKNMVSGGAVQHNNSSNPATYGVSGASTGPAQDGRVKPDLAGFYDNIATTSSTGYTSAFGGTSGGTPMVCGTIGIFFQMWHEQVWPGFGGGASVFESRANLTTAKAAMINTAFRFPFTQNGLNRFRQGWGMPNLKKLYDSRTSTFIVNADQPINNLGKQTYEIEVSSGTPELLVTMCYIDPQGPLVATQNRVNDLSLKVTSPSGTIYWGNNGLTAGNFNTSGGSSNTKDTVENVFLQNPAAGTWTVEVLGDEITFDTDPNTAGTNAVFSLWLTGGVEASGCYADCDENGALDFFDFLCFQNEFAGGTAYADCDGNGSLDFFDFLCYQNAFAAGCP